LAIVFPLSCFDSFSPHHPIRKVAPIVPTDGGDKTSLCFGGCISGMIAPSSLTVGVEGIGAPTDIGLQILYPVRKTEQVEIGAQINQSSVQKNRGSRVWMWEKGDLLGKVVAGSC
jgi:hypothetical protein